MTYRRHLETLTVPVYSPLMKRPVMVTPRQWRLLVLVMRRRQGWTQRQLAAEAGYMTPGGVSRTLHLMSRLGIVALSTTRGCKGQTVAWIRRGVTAMSAGVANVAHHVRERVENSKYVESVRQHSGPEPLSSLFSRLLEGPVGQGTAA